MRPCPHCSKPIKDDVELCKWCLHPVGLNAAAAISAEREQAVSEARAARAAGARLFQTTLALSQTTGFVAPGETRALQTKKSEHATVLDAIEAEGWRLNHADYVFRTLGTVSRDKFLSSGQREAVSGEIIGIYIFRKEPV